MYNEDIVNNSLEQMTQKYLNQENTDEYVIGKKATSPWLIPNNVAPVMAIDSNQKKSS